MTKIRPRGEDVRKFILENVEKNPADIAKKTSEKFGISRQAVNIHLQKLTAERALAETGNTRSRRYTLASLYEWHKTYPIAPGLAEDLAWREDIKSVLGHLPENVLNIWHHGFTEMFNNAIDHSEGKAIIVHVAQTATTTRMFLGDDGVGIFKKIQTALNLLDERHAILELAKGKLTTDPKNHSGEGIFFTSRMFDDFAILSGEVFFNHVFGEPEDWVLERKHTVGTSVFMRLNNHTARTTKKVFDAFTSGEDYGFNKTVVPVNLAQYGNELLVSRSQAKRLLARVELFKEVIFNFEGVAAVGQAFADEIFRVFANQHPEIRLVPLHANNVVRQMIDRARTGLDSK